MLFKFMHDKLLFSAWEARSASAMMMPLQGYRSGHVTWFIDRTVERNIDKITFIVCG